MQKACCVLKNEKSEKKDPEAFIRNSEKSAECGSFFVYMVYNADVQILLRKKTFGMKAFFRCAGMP